MAASGAYIAALGADRIFVHGNSIVGSIGVLVQYPNFSGLMDKVGVKFEVHQILAAEGRAQRVRADQRRRARCDGAVDLRLFVWFKDLVRQRRGMTDDELARVDDGRVFTGRQGIPLKLADAIGGEREAIDWLQAQKGLPKGLPVRDWKTEPDFLGLKLTSAAADAADILGWSAAAGLLRSSSWGGDASVDGLVSVWQVHQGN